MSLITAADIRTRLQRHVSQWSDEEDDAAEALAEEITAYIEDRTGGVLLTVGATFVYDADVSPTPTIWMPHVPKVPVTVTKVEVGGEELAGWKVDRLHGVRRTDRLWWRGEVEITYDYGFDPAGSDPALVALRGAALDLAAPRHGNPERVLQARMGSDRSISFADSSEAAGGMDVQVKALLDSFRPVGVA